MKVTEAYAAQRIGSFERQIGNAVRFARSRGKVVALSPGVMTNTPHPDPRLPRRIAAAHEILELDPGQPAPDGWVIVDQADDR